MATRPQSGSDEFLAQMFGFPMPGTATPSPALQPGDVPGRTPAFPARIAPGDVQRQYGGEVVQQARDLYYTQPSQVYGGQRVADPSMLQQQAFAGGGQLGQGYMGNAAQGMLGRTMAGQFLGQNPYLDQMAQRAIAPLTEAYSQEIMPGLTSSFSRAGRLGSGAHQAALGRASGRYSDAASGMLAQMYGQEYGQERSRMMQAAGMAPGFAASQRADIGMMAGLGAQQRGIGQEQIGAEMAQFYEQQAAPFEDLARYQQALMPSYGIQPQQQMEGGNRGAGILGGAMAGGGMATMMGLSNPYTAAMMGGGALLGGFM